MRLKLRENADINVVTGISDIIIDSINKKWDNIRDLNSIIVNLNEEGFEDMVPVIESILEDENKNVGKLQQLVELISPTAKSIDDGRQEAINELDNNEEIKVEEMKLDENFSNVPEETTTTVDPTFGKAIEDKEEDEKIIENALKENEKLAKETIPKEGDTGKKVTSPALKAMHLSESLFDGEGSSVNFNIGDRVQVHFEDSPDKIGEVRDIISDDVIEVEEFDSTGSPYRIDRYYKQQLTKLDESLLLEDNNKETLRKKLGNYVVNKAKQYNMNISDKDKAEFIMFAMKKVAKLIKKEGWDKQDIIDLVDGLFIMSFNLKGEYVRSMEEKLLTEDKDEENNSIKLDIAREQIKRFKEGKMPKDWSSEDYIKDLVNKKHLTKEEGDKLLSEGMEDLSSADEFRSWMKMILSDVKQAYHLLLNNDADSFDLAASLINSSLYDMQVLDEAMQKFNWDNNE